MSENEMTKKDLKKLMKEWRDTHPDLSEMYEKYKTFQDISKEYLEGERPKSHSTSGVSNSTVMV